MTYGDFNDPLQRHISYNISIVDNLLVDPGAARRYANDDTLPDWIRELATALSGDALRPALRCAIKNCLDDPRVAGRWFTASCRTGMPAWFRSFAEIASKRKKFWK